MALSKEHTITLAMAFVVVFMDMLNYSIIVPVLPFLVKEYKSTTFEEGILFTGYCVTQLASLLAFGSFSDVYGRKLFLILSLFGSCFGSLFQYYSTTMWSLIFWRAFTGLFAGSQILVQAVVADVTLPEERNPYLARLEATINAAFVLGPVAGGLLGQVNYRLPLLVAGVVSGIALIAALIFLKESNPVVLNKRKEEKIADVIDDNGSEEKEPQNEKQESKISDAPAPIVKVKKPKVTLVMVLCFAFDFLNRWTVNAFDARYGIYLADKFKISSSLYSIVVCVDSLWCCIEQAVIYPWLVNRLCIPVPYLAACGAAVEVVAYFIMAASPNMWGSVIGSFVLWSGFAVASPASVSIISTTNAANIQGKVLSWNSFISQFSLIISPMILAAIYVRNRDAIYYFSMIVLAAATSVMGYMSSLKDAKYLGKASSPTVVVPQNTAVCIELSGL